MVAPRLPILSSSPFLFPSSVFSPLSRSRYSQSIVLRLSFPSRACAEWHANCVPLHCPLSFRPAPPNFRLPVSGFAGSVVRRPSAQMGAIILSRFHYISWPVWVGCHPQLKRKRNARRGWHPPLPGFTDSHSPSGPVYQYALSTLDF